MGTILPKQGKVQLEQEVPTLKIVLVGEPGVGKTSVFLRYTKNQFDYSYQPSVSVAIGNVVKKINIPYQGVVSVVIWDVPGREEMDLRKSYYKNVDAAIVVVDMSELDTIGLAPTWKQDVLNHAQFTMENSSNKYGKEDDMEQGAIPVLLLGNKADKIKPKEEDEDADNGDGCSESSATMRELEETSVKHGFIGSVAVSAKEGDGSVHAAIQTLVRHLLQRRIAKHPKQGIIRNLFNSPEVKNGEFRDEVNDGKPFLPFLKVKINEFDDVFKLCEEPMKTVEQCGGEYFKAMHLFKRSCCAADLAASSKSSLEECIEGLKEAIVDGSGECGLKIVDDGGFVKFVIVDDVIEDIPGPLTKLLRLFNTRLAIAAKNILSKCSVVHGSLKLSEQQLDDLLKSFKQLARSSSLSEKSQRKAWIDLEANRTRLAEACETAMECLQVVDNDCKKIKAAILW